MKTRLFIMPFIFALLFSACEKNESIQTITQDSAAVSEITRQEISHDAVSLGKEQRIAEGKLLTEPIAYCNVSGTYEPQATTYTKPLLVLINEFSISAGDFFPAYLKDNEIGTFFGSRTNGAGGSVRSFGPFGYFDLAINYTSTLAWRRKEVTTKNGIKTHYLEGVGVSPDIEYEITMDDFLNDYKDYKAAVEKALLDLIEKNNE